MQMQSPSTPTIDKTVEFLRELVRQERDPGARKLPTVRRLSVMAGVSHVTMWKAVKALQAENVLTARQGSGIYVQADEAPGIARPGSAEATPRSRSESTADRIRTDILTGVYRFGTVLPACKEMTDRYGVSYRVLKRALQGLLQANTIASYKRGYRVPEASWQHHNRAVILVARGDSYGKVRLYSPATHENLRALQSSCTNAGVRLAVLTYDRATDRLYGPGGSSPGLSRSDSALGFHLWTAGISPSSLQGLIGRLAPQGKPIAVLDEEDPSRLSGLHAAGGGIRLFSLGLGTEAGRRVGQYLLNLGHRAVAYVSPVHRNVWSRERHEGLVEAFAAAGLVHAVRAFTRDINSGTAEFSEMSGTVREALKSLLPKGDGRGSGTAETVRFSVIDSLQRRIDPMVGEETIRALLTPLQTAALEDCDVTAWVADNDFVALECLGFLSRNGRTVPADMSVVGFDDGLGASTEGLTSYNFNGAAATHAMLSYLFEPRRTRPIPAGKKVVEIEGFVNVRDSTGAPARQGS